jgi:tetratricopeptide (TPR) repeat protein
MRLVSVTPAGGGREALIADALQSVVGWVDVCLLVDTGPTAAEAIEVGKRVVGDKVVIRQYSYTTMGDVRNACLRFAAELGDWAIVLDTDERIHLRGDDVPAILTDAKAETLMAPCLNGAYPKERAIKLPAQGHYAGHIHEGYVYSGAREFFPRLRFDEVIKGPEESLRNAQAILEGLQPQLEAEPAQARWHYYAGDALACLGRYNEALAAFSRAWLLSSWADESAWSCFRICCILQQQSKWEDALTWAAKGMAKHPGIGELAWAAGAAALNGGRNAEAVYWSHIAIVQGSFRGFGRKVPRLHFSEPIGLYEGPFEVLGIALGRLGDINGAAAAAAAAVQAQAARMAA